MHDKKEFWFVDKNGLEVMYTSKPYTFEIEDVLINRFGIKILDDFHKTNKFDRNIELNDVEKDFPKLLDGPTNIDWKKQNLDEIMSVYFFFLEYKSYAYIRVWSQQMKTIASDLETIQATLNSISQSISNENTKGNILFGS